MHVACSFGNVVARLFSRYDRSHRWYPSNVFKRFPELTWWQSECERLSQRQARLVSPLPSAHPLEAYCSPSRRVMSVLHA